jgi:hypothetical protein
MRRSVLLMSLAVAAIGLCGFYASSVSAEPSETLPSGRGIGTREHQPQGAANGGGSRTPVATASNGISYHGGPVMTAGSNVYYIWYGNWGTDTAKTILPALATGLSGSPYFNINTSYYNAANVKVTNAVMMAGQYTWDTAAYGTALGDANIQAIVAWTINNGKLAYDANGVYFVLTSPEITETSGFCTNYCGWHTHFALNGAAANDVKYAFVGNPSKQCPTACEAQQASSPNGNPGADGMASVISHELEEATTDPDLTAWYDTRGYENADKCAWTFGTELKASNGSLYNMTLGGLKFLIQRNWVNANGGSCALSY